MAMEGKTLKKGKFENDSGKRYVTGISNIAFYGIKRPVHIIISVRNSYGEMRSAISRGWVTLTVNFRLKIEGLLFALISMDH